MLRKFVPVSTALLLAVVAAIQTGLGALDFTTGQATALANAKATGSLKVTIKPKQVKRLGARWRVDGGAWQKSGTTVNGLSTGDHTVAFKTVSGWKAPKNKKASIQDGLTTSLTGKYVSADTLTIMLPGNVPLDMVWVPAGSFMMGRYSNEQGSDASEDPQHQVTLTHGFWLGKYEVTQAQWTAVKGGNPSNFTGDDSRPVEQVSWNDVQGFLTAMNALGQGAFGLPTEAEWEYAYRAGTTTRYYWGDDPTYTSITDYAWYDTNAGSTTHPVGLKLPNAWGLYDMSGNVYEWCSDWFGTYSSGSATDPTGPSTGVSRVVRGGSWLVYSYYGRAAFRTNGTPDLTASHVGFRLLRSQD